MTDTSLWFGWRAPDDRMSPHWQAHEPVILEPTDTVAPGDYIAFERVDGGSNFGRVVSERDGNLVIEHFAPRAKGRVDRGTIAALYRQVTAREIYCN